jgi:hypothetical protein
MVAACWVHLSNLLILPLVLGSLVVAVKIARQDLPTRRVLALAIILIGAWPGLMLANKAVDGEAYISRYSHVFLMSRLAETGILHSWLAEHCADGHYGICQYTDSIPTTNKGFMWSERSPLTWQGGAMQVRDEYRTIINATLREPRYIMLHVKGSLVSTWELLGLWRVADELEGTYYRQSYSAPYGSIASLVPRELTAYLNSAQNTGPGTLGLAWIDPLYRILLVMSLLMTVRYMMHREHRRRALPVLVTGLATFVLSAWVCATFSTVDSRYMARTAWLLPMMISVTAFAVHGRRDRPEAQDAQPPTDHQPD